MTVGDLKEMLEDLDDDVKVRLAMQPNYPMKGSIRNLCVEHKAGADDVFWIACSDHEGYSVPEGVWDEQEVFDEEGGVE